MAVKKKKKIDPRITVSAEMLLDYKIRLEIGDIIAIANDTSIDPRTVGTAAKKGLGTKNVHSKIQKWLDKNRPRITQSQTA